MIICSTLFLWDSNLVLQRKYELAEVRKHTLSMSLPVETRELHKQLRAR